MLKDLTFNEVCRFLKKDDGELIEMLDNLLGVAVVFSPVVLGAKALPFLSLLGAKNELTKLGRKLLNKIISKKENDYLERVHRMESVYALICFTAFFDALDNELTDDFRNRINLQIKDKSQIILSSDCKNHLANKNVKIDSDELSGVFNVSLPFPHPTLTFKEIKEQLKPLYEQMTKGFDEFVEKMTLYEEIDQKKALDFHKIIDKLPRIALQFFEAQYYELALKYSEFLIWSQIKEKEAFNKQNLEYLERYCSLAMQAETKIDVGFVNLQETVRSIPNLFREIEAKEVVKGLRQYYEARIEEAVIEDKEIPEDDNPTLVFPKISEAFVPQSYRVLRYLSKDMHLEKESTWHELKINNDLDAFFVRYLSSPYSIEAPLLILGHPGSGKSLLTKVLSARLMCEAYTPIRIPLREVDAELGIESLVEKQIARDTGFKIKSWADFASQFPDRPILIILDGYDELLQASGKVFSAYLDRVEKFQQAQIIHERPVRVIITSRITLINKAAIPIGATVLRLLEFNKAQRDAWISIWNQTNESYFSLCKPTVRSFSLPEGKGIEYDKIMELAKQPLLLLMLAIYDSDNNSLHNSIELNRTVLYDRLLRRFVRRERRRYVDDFDYLSEYDQNSEIDRAMKRLGVAAIGMYNRRKLHILSSELSSDLKFFKLERKIEIQNDRAVTEGDLLLGSFFFIHKSSCDDISESYSNMDTSIEFLHNTFGEFLTADFILNFALQEAKAIYSLKKDKNLYGEFERKVQDPNGISKEWFICLMFAPIYSRPVIADMFREWAKHYLAKKDFKYNEFLKCFDIIVKIHVKMTLESRDFPDIMKVDDVAQFADIPFLGLLATYTLNLIILRTVLDTGEFVFNEEEYCISKNCLEIYRTSTRPWDRLAQIWRSWFKLENLSGLSTIIYAKREDRKVILRARNEFESNPNSNQLEIVISTSEALADNITGSLAGLHSKEYGNMESSQIDYLKKCLVTEKIDLSFEFLVRHLREFIVQANTTNPKIDKLIIRCVHEVVSKNQTNNLIISFFNLLGIAFERKLITHESKYTIFRNIIHYEHFQVYKSSDIAIEWLRILQQFKGTGLIERYGKEFFERVMNPEYSIEMMNIRPGIVIELLRTLQQFREINWIEHYIERFFRYVMNPKCFEEIIDTRPDIAIEWMHILQQFKGTGLIERYGEKFFERAINSGGFVEVIEERPDIAIELMGILQRFRGIHSIERYGEKIFGYVMNPERFGEMIDTRPDIAIEWMRILQQFRGTRFIEGYGEKFFKYVMNRRRLLEIIDIRPDIAIEWIRTLQQFKGTRWIEGYGEEFFEYVMNRRRFREIMDIRPDIAIEWIRILQQFKGTRWIEGYGEEFFEYVMNRRRFREIIDIRPDIAIEWMRILQQFRGTHFIECYGEKFFEHIIDPSYFVRIIYANPSVCIEYLRCLKRFKDIQRSRNFSRKVLDKFGYDVVGVISKEIKISLVMIRILHLCEYKNLVDKFKLRRTQIDWRFDLFKVPSDYITDLRWYAQVVYDNELLKDIEYYLS